MEIENIVVDLKNLNSPVYAVENQHKFNEFQNKCEELKTLVGPVYNVETKHNFKEIEKIE